ncbi:MAG: FmdB family zinc ribbon protein [Pseudomonadales bacterium]
MPIFDFECGQCGHVFEKLVLRSDAPAPNCADCDSTEVEKKVSAPAFRLSGSGWYETDFKTGAKKNLASGTQSSNDS